MRSTLLFLLLFFLLPIPTYAHSMIIEPINDSQIHVRYADGSFSTRTVVTVYDAENHIVETGQLDDNGTYTIKHKEAVRVVVDDNIGHKADWQIGEEIVQKSTVERFGIVAIVILVFVSIAIYFSKYNSQPLRT